MVSIIIRTKNEERWITACLSGIFNQDYKDFEVIIVDNRSTDKTVEKAKNFTIAEVLTCDDYLPGKALNIGVRKAKGEYIACISGHCIPVDSKWLNNLLDNFKRSEIGGVYGRQEPMEFTSDADKRDLALVFGLDRKVQRKDSFFHNANSMFRKRLWEEIPFDEEVTNIEDRVWAKMVLEKGYEIIYEPKASVYHYHGIHQNGNVERCTNVVRILESLHANYSYKSIEIENLNTIGIIPIRGPIQYLNGKPLLLYTLERARESKYLKRIIVSTDNKETARIAEQFGAEVPFIRDLHFSEEHVSLAQVLSYSLEKIEGLKIFPDLVVSLEATFPFRPKGLIDEMILQLTQNGLDSVIVAKRENKAIWKERDNKIVQLDEGLTPRQFKDPTFIELKGICCVTHPEFLREGSLFGERIGIYEVSNPCSPIEVREKEDFAMAEKLIEYWIESNKYKAD
ncbi:MAG: glycosyltransferase [Candidatus Brocadiaceae bacterium]|nr:glycosyltransferase [Candidatus Brocadiaceae bacterium]